MVSKCRVSVLQLARCGLLWKTYDSEGELGTTVVLLPGERGSEVRRGVIRVRKNPMWGVLYSGCGKLPR